MDDVNLQGRLLEELALVLAPLRAAGEDEVARAFVLEQLGWESGALDGDSLDDLLGGIATLADGVVALAKNPPKTLNDVVAALPELAKVFEGLYTLGKGASSGLPAELASIGVELVEFSILWYLNTQHPAVFAALELLTIIRAQEDADPADLPETVIAGGAVLRRSVPRPRLAIARLGDLLTDPAGTLRSAYFPKGLARASDVGPGAEKLFRRIANLVNAVGFAVAVVADDDERGSVAAAGVTSRIVTPALSLYIEPGSLFSAKDDGTPVKIDLGATLALSPADRGDLGLVVLLFGAAALSIPVGSFALLFELSAAGVGFAIGSKGFQFLADAGHVDLRGKLGLAKRPSAEAEPAFLAGSATGTRLEIGSFGVEVTAALSKGEQDYGFVVRAGKSAIVIAAGDGDGFLQKILPKEGFRIDFDLAVGWSSAKGVYFDGGAGFEVTLPVHLSLLGIIDVDSVSLAFFIDKSGLRLSVATSVGVHLGPVNAAIDKMGLRTTLEFKDGNLGPVNASLGFKPPSGLGIVVDAGPVTGGGFISFDPDNGRYAGVLQLKIYSVALTAIGLLDTKLPGGKSGFSFLIIITVEFTPIQLGFGFTLNGVGGLAGINRTMKTDILRQGLREHSLDNILFPRDPVKRATQLISDLGRVFPPAEGRYVFGPMVKIGWGTFVEAELGILLELPSPIRIAILGQINAFFPVKEAAIVEIHLDVLGILDFGEKLFSLDASLHDSRVLLFSLAGDMALRLTWGDDPSFLFSLGGFNPHFQPPPTVPTLRRLTLSLGYEDNPRIALEAYFALTSNSFQFGAALSLHAALGPLEINGRFGFDALFIFSPFSFIIDFEAALDIRIGALRLLAIHIVATLSGPTPWRITGDVSVSLLFFEITVHADITFGEEQHDELPAGDTWEPLRKAIISPSSWSAPRLPSPLEVCKLSTPAGAESLILVDPVGSATMREKVLPLGQLITKFAEADIQPVRYDLDPKVEVGGGDVMLRPVSESFAPGQFRKLTDAEKISSPSFVDMQGGFTLGSEAVGVGGGVSLELTYATTILDSADEIRDAGVQPSTVEGLLAAAVVRPTEPGPSGAGIARFAPRPGAAPVVAMDAELFVVADKERLQARQDITVPVSMGLAQGALHGHLAAHPQEAAMLLVIPAADATAGSLRRSR